MNFLSPWCYYFGEDDRMMSQKIIIRKQNKESFALKAQKIGPDVWPKNISKYNINAIYVSKLKQLYCLEIESINKSLEQEQIYLIWT